MPAHTSVGVRAPRPVSASQRGFGNAPTHRLALVVLLLPDEQTHLVLRSGDVKRVGHDLQKRAHAVLQQAVRQRSPLQASAVRVTREKGRQGREMGSAHLVSLRAVCHARTLTSRDPVGGGKGIQPGLLNDDEDNDTLPDSRARLKRGCQCQWAAQKGGVTQAGTRLITVDVHTGCAHAAPTWVHQHAIDPFKPALGIV
jgi:hypothetical protein